ncbi:S24/S26 family peptidase [Methanobacterium congolense]|uniref:Peptidase S24/S26A/S26B n=1 Tax=Methanobacterium congolense TaxID=118062 RepID=A0A1D3L3L3_9EURY|nr:S24/S26 family peptidase [Methanobacterium congolense]SCG86145.1 Peptidase S24/S26A/S26B [Methanobacterium congolense]
MKSNNKWLIAGLIVLIAVVASAVYVVENLHNVGITVQTNGTSVNVKASSVLPVPSAMITEMNEKALADVQDEDSTVSSVKADMQAIAKEYNYTATVTIQSQFGKDQLPMPATVNGTSMLPTLQDGQNLILLKTDNYKVGDIVVAKHPDYGLIVKRLAVINGSMVYLKSDNNKTEVVGTETIYENGYYQVVTIEKTPLSTWLPRENIIGVVKDY